MTFAIYIVLFLGLFIAVLNFLPVAGDLPLALSDSLVLIVGYMKAWNAIFPIVELLLCVTVVGAYFLGLWLWHVLRGVLSIVRGHSSG